MNTQIERRPVPIQKVELRSRLPGALAPRSAGVAATALRPGSTWPLSRMEFDRNKFFVGQGFLVFLERRHSDLRLPRVCGMLGVVTQSFLSITPRVTGNARPFG